MPKNDQPAEDADDRTKGAGAAQRARDKAEEYVEAGRDEARRLYHKGRREAHQLAEHAEDYYDELSGMVRRHPVQAIGIAAGVGLLVGLLIARR